MDLRTHVIVPVLFAACSVMLHGQQNAVWFFGFGAGLRFDGGGYPSPESGGQIQSWEGSSVAYDRATGALLMYSDGRTVWDQLHRRMPQGTGLAGASSSTQAALLVQSPGDDSLYYLFTSANVEDMANVSVGVNYSLIDMRLRGGFGDVIERDVPLLKPASEKLTAIRHCNDKNYWILAHESSTDRFFVWLLDSDGIHAPNRYSTGPVLASTNSNAGWLLAAPDGRHLAMALDDVPGDVWLFDFDLESGAISNGRDLGPSSGDYGVGFSPDGSKLYTSSTNLGFVVQYDLSLPTFSDVIGSRVVLFQGGARFEIGGFKIGPDGRVYVARHKQSAISVIDFPNRPGFACQYRHAAISLGSGTGGLSLPNSPVDPPQGDPYVRISHDTVICPGTEAAIVVLGGVHVRWEKRPDIECDSCRTIVVRPDSATTYIANVVRSSGCIERVSTNVSIAPVEVSHLEHKKTLCLGDSTVLVTGAQGDHFWSPAKGLSCVQCSDPTAKPDTTTTYLVRIRNWLGCESTDSVTVEVAHDAIVLDGALSNTLTMDSVATSMTGCKPIALHNQSDSSRLITHVRLRSNIDFSIPPSQFPIVVPAHGTADLVVCFRPSSSRTGFDTLTLLDDCPTTFFIEGTGKPLGLGDGTVCDSLSVRVVPFSNASFVEIQVEGGNVVNRGSFVLSLFVGRDDDVRIEMVDVTGRTATTLLTGHYSRGWHRLECSSTNVGCGVYQLRVTAGTRFAAIPLCVVD